MTPEEAWDLGEEEWFAAEQHKLNRVRVHGYALAVGARVQRAEEHLERCTDALLAARKRAEEARERLNVELADLEIMARVVARGDADEYERIAVALEEMGF